METRRDVFQAIAEPTRREIISLLADRPLHLNAIAENFNVSRPAISQHIKILEECGLVIIRQQGRERYCEAQLEKLTEIVDWVEQSRKVWVGRFRKMDQLLRANAMPEKKNRQKKVK